MRVVRESAKERAAGAEGADGRGGEVAEYGDQHLGGEVEKGGDRGRRHESHALAGADGPVCGVLLSRRISKRCV